MVVFAWFCHFPYCMCNCWRGVLTRLIVYYYHGAGSAAFPNYILLVDGPTINTITSIITSIIVLITERSSFALACKIIIFMYCFFIYFFNHFIRFVTLCWGHIFVAISKIDVTVCQLAPLSWLALTEVVQSTACLPVFVIAVWKGQLYLLMKFFLLSVLNVTATILWFPSLPSLYFGVVPSSGAPSRLASFTKETCTWKSQRCHHYVQCWCIPVPTGPGQHAVSAAGCLHTIR